MTEPVHLLGSNSLPGIFRGAHEETLHPRGRARRQSPADVTPHGTQSCLWSFLAGQWMNGTRMDGFERGPTHTPKTSGDCS